jgi:hypothetical protein
MYRIYEVFLALYIRLPDHLFCNVYELLAYLLVRSFVNLSEYLLEKHQPLRKVKEFQVKGTLLTIFS